jgi:deoxyadenosine/deoxycytidine kinase
MPIFTLDGNIGCGKSTLLEYIHMNHLLPIDLEPIKKWQPYLNDIYCNNKGVCEFQVRVWLDRCWIQPKQDTTMIMERSPYFQQKVFIPVNYENDRLTKREVDMLNEMYDKSSQIWNPSGYIYLRSNPDKCIERIKIRSRQSEDAIDTDYIKRLHNLHETNYFLAASSGMPMVCIDIENKSIPDIAKEIIQVLKAMGVLFMNDKYTSFTSSINNEHTYKDDTVSFENFNFINNTFYKNCKTAKTGKSYNSGSQNNELHGMVNLEDTNLHNKSIASKLRDFSRDANIRRKNKSDSIKQLPIPNIFKIEKTPLLCESKLAIPIPQYKILKKPQHITDNNKEDILQNDPIIDSSSELSEDTKDRATFQEAFTDDSS